MLVRCVIFCHNKPRFGPGDAGGISRNSGWLFSLDVPAVAGFLILLCSMDRDLALILPTGQTPFVA